VLSLFYLKTIETALLNKNKILKTLSVD